MEKADLEKLAGVIKDKSAGPVTIMETIGQMAMDKDIPAFIKENGRLPTAGEIVDQYKEVKNFENVLGMADMKVARIEKFIAALLADADVDDFKVAEVE
jgi:hypothetical protein